MAFEPVDLGPIYGRAAGEGSIGGIFACNLAGPRRLKAGAARDHCWAFARSVGAGDLQIRRPGGQKRHWLRSVETDGGAYGTLAAMTEVTFKVMPKPEDLDRAGQGLDPARRCAPCRRP